MSNIIKSVAVVDERPDPDRFVVRASEETDRAVIKRQALAGQVLVKARTIPQKDELLEEINRLRIEMNDVSKELRIAKRELEDITYEVKELQLQKEALEKLDGLTIDDQAKAILKDAEKKAAQIVEWAKQEAAESIDQLKAQGYEDGLQMGANEARNRYFEEQEPDILKLQDLLQRLSSLREEMVSEYENDILSLIITVAEKVIGKTLADDPTVVADMLREVLDQNRREAYIKVTLSPDLMPARAKVGERVREAIMDISRQVDIAVDIDATPGSMVVETAGGYTDLSVQTQLDNMHEALLGE